MKKEEDASRRETPSSVCVTDNLRYVKIINISTTATAKLIIKIGIIITSVLYLLSEEILIGQLVMRQLLAGVAMEGFKG